MKPLLIALVMALASPASALSCLRPNLAEAFNGFADSPDPYMLVVGKLGVKKPPRPREGTPQTATGTLNARHIGLKGIGEPLRRSVTVRTQCVASWCGGFPDGRDNMIMFLRIEGDRLAFDSHACPTGGMMPYSPDRVALMVKCLRRGHCTDAEIAAFARE